MKANGSDSMQKMNNNAPAANQATSMRNFIMRMSDQIKTALPATITGERMCRIAMTAISKNPKLAECTQSSFMGALLTSAQLGLECNTPLGQSYLLPYKNTKNGVYECQFQLGYQGLIDLCYRTKQYKTIQARIVYEGDDFTYEYGINENLIHRPKEQSNNPIYVYAYYELINGAKSFEVMSWDSIMEYAKQYSMAVQKGWTSPWTTAPEEMAKKTLLKKVLKYAPKTVEIADAITSDSSIVKTNVITDNGKVFIDKDVIDVDFTPVETTPEEPKEENKPVEEVRKEEVPTQEEMDAAFVEQAEMYNNPSELF